MKIFAIKELKVTLDESKKMICAIIKKKKNVIKITENKEELERRFYMRVKIFENVYFIRKFEFSEFTQALEEYAKKDWDETMKEARTNLDATLKLFKEISDEEVLDPSLREEIGKLKRVCVKNGLAITKLDANKAKLDQAKVVFKHTEHPFYPVIDVTF